MTIEVFIEAVRSMRKHQKAYFKDRLQSDLIAAKKWEAIVDKGLAEGIVNPETEDESTGDAIQLGFFVQPDYDKEGDQNV